MTILNSTLESVVDVYTTAYGYHKRFVADIEGEVRALVSVKELYAWGGGAAVGSVAIHGPRSPYLEEYIQAGDTELNAYKPKGIAEISKWKIKSCEWAQDHQGWLVCLVASQWEAMEEV